MEFNLIHEFHNLSWITEINELFHAILIYWDAPVHYRWGLKQFSTGLPALSSLQKVEDSWITFKMQT